MANLSNKLGVSPAGFVAGGTVVKNRAVKLDTTAGQVIAATAIAGLTIGIAENGALVGENVSVQTYGIAKAELGTGGATLGAQLMVEASAAGVLVIAAGATAHSVAIALEAGDAGETIRVLLRPALNGPANA